MNMMMYADFILYGPIEFAGAVYPACAMTDAIIAYTARKLGTRPKVSRHPLSKIFNTGLLGKVHSERSLVIKLDRKMTMS